MNSAIENYNDFADSMHFDQKHHIVESSDLYGLRLALEVTKALDLDCGIVHQIREQISQNELQFSGDIY